MPIPEDLEKKVEDLVSEGETELALQHLREHMATDPERDQDAYRQVILLTGQYSVWEKEKLQGIKSDSSEFNRITSQVLVLLDNLRFKRKKRIVTPPVEPQPQPQPQQPVFQPQQATPTQQHPRSSRDAKNNKVGKYIRWGLMGLGAFFLLAILVALFDETDSGIVDPTYNDSSLPDDVFIPQSNNTSIFRSQLGGTTWWHADLGYVYFNADGMSATYDNGDGLFTMDGQGQDGYLYGSYVESGGAGDVAMVPPNGSTILNVYVKAAGFSSFGTIPYQLLKQ